MKILVAGLAGIALAALAGCYQGAPGGPGATGIVPPGPFHAQAVDSFNLSASLLPIGIKQGETQQVAIGIKRSSNFDEDVTLAFTKLPPGVTFHPARPTIRHGDAEAKVMLKATSRAALGDFSIGVIGHPSKGADAAIMIKITVAKR